MSDSEAMADALAQLEDARDDLESMRRDTAARRRLGPLWLSFVEPLVEAVEIAEQRVRILWRGQAPSDLPAHNKASMVVPWRRFEDEPPTGMATS